MLTDNLLPDLAHQFVAGLPVDITVEHDGFNAINPVHAEALGEELTHFVAFVIASLLDAGSERDAVAENLIDAITDEVQNWVPES